jgi:hypothetical protein
MERNGPSADDMTPEGEEEDIDGDNENVITVMEQSTWCEVFDTS